MVVILPPRYSSDNPLGVFTAPAPNEQERIAQALRWLKLIDAYDGLLPQGMDDLRKEWNSRNAVSGTQAIIGESFTAQSIKDYIEGRRVSP